MTRIKSTLPLLICILGSGAHANDFLQNDHLLSDYGDWKTDASNHGVYVDMEYTTVFQSTHSKDSTDTLMGRFDLKTALNLSQMGLWDNGSIHFQLQAHQGNTGRAGFHSSPYVYSNTAGFMGDDFFLSSFYYLHRFSSSSLLIGKLDALELLKDGTFYGGAGRYGFMNLAFVAPPSGIIPPAFLGAMLNWKTESFDWTAMIFDPINRYSENSFSDPFSDGVAASLTVGHTRRVFGRSSNVTLSGSYSSAEGKDLENLFDRTASVNGKYNIRLQASHNLFESADNPAHSWGLYTRFAIADGNPNLLQRTFTAGLGGKSFIEDRFNDQWGIGYFSNNLSDDLQYSLHHSPLDKSLSDEKGMEAYYSYALTPAINLTADIQYIESLDQKDNVLFGVRANIRL